MSVCQYTSQHLDMEELGRNMAFRLGIGKGKTFIRFQHSFFKPALKWLGASLVAQTVKNLPAVREIWVWSQGQEDPLEKGMANHSSILVQRIPWTEEPGGSQSMGSQRDRNDWATHTHTKCLESQLSQDAQRPTVPKRLRSEGSAWARCWGNLTKSYKVPTHHPNWGFVWPELMDKLGNLQSQI